MNNSMEGNSKEAGPKMSVFGNIRAWLGIPLLGGFAIALISCFDCLQEGRYPDFLEEGIISFVFWFALANGNTLLSHYIDKKWSWIGQPLKRFLIGVIAIFAYTIVASLLIIYIYVEFYFKVNMTDVVEQQGWFSLLVMPLSITAFMAIFLHGREFLLNWRQAAIDMEQLKNKSLTSQYESLKNQVNPHFLFNSLNALSSLVYSNQDRAVDFIRKLSDVYRYVLDNQNEEVVLLSSELEFAKSFIYLNKIRFGENLEVEIAGENLVSNEDKIPPLAIQMLLENAFKHNVVSREQHLLLSITVSESYVIVSNKRNPKPTPEESSGVGLDNIRARYSFLSNREVEVNADNNKFEVKLPILKELA